MFWAGGLGKPVYEVLVLALIHNSASSI